MSQSNSARPHHVPIAAPVTDILLSLAKDSRYISHLTLLLAHVLAPYLLTHNHENNNGDETSIDETNGREALKAIEPELNLLAKVLHITLVQVVVFTSGSDGGSNSSSSDVSAGETMGMEYMNLGYYHDSDSNRVTKSFSNTIGETSIDGEAGAGAGAIAGAVAGTNISANTKNLEYNAIIDGRNTNPSNDWNNYKWKFRRNQGLPRALTSSPSRPPSYGRALTFLLLYILPPYLAERAGRGGWKRDLRIFWVNFRRAFLGDETTRSYNEVRARENLRGEDRRRVYSEMRRRMLQRALEREEEEVRLRRRRNDEGRDAPDAAFENCNNAEHNSSISASQSHQYTERNDESERAERRIRSNYRGEYLLLKSLLQKVRSFAWTALRSISFASQTLSPGAHELPSNSSISSNTINDDINNVDNDDGGNDEQQTAQTQQQEQQQQHHQGFSQHQNSTSHINASLDRLTATIKWIMRLHLALFYLNGRYPTFAHRLTGVGIRTGQLTNTNINTHNNSNSINFPIVVADRPSYKVIGSIIFLQASAKLFQALTQISANAWYAFLIWRIRRRINRERHQQQHDRFSQTVNGAISNNRIRCSDRSSIVDAESEFARSQREEFVTTVEKCVPSFRSFTSRSDRNYHDEYTSNHTTDGEEDNVVTCRICMNERTHPAAPSTCGHVFCWKCIQQWIATVRPECPICRASVKPQNVIALYDYSPT